MQIPPVALDNLIEKLQTVKLNLEKKLSEVMHRCRKLEEDARTTKKELAMMMYGIPAPETIASPPRGPLPLRDPYIVASRVFRTMHPVTSQLLDVVDIKPDDYSDVPVVV
ncbi:hypothetical protein L1987_13949 [Smallanthus sonchifolius]|uniref:Uncharacterized protein n=1 Tax=Smallanthus sonchifolius TaxID=185202 RepID=A0ACB9JK45_9ASTR|nr:hypothetical protein L1987_13949 [Smallanthus sonchifolius]